MLMPLFTLSGTGDCAPLRDWMYFHQNALDNVLVYS